MSCCGSTRRPVAGSPGTSPSAKRSLPGTGRPAAEAPMPVAFVYTGATRLAADGPITHRRYRFEHPNAVVEVDGRDAASFAAIPNLRRVSG